MAVHGIFVIDFEEHEVCNLHGRPEIFDQEAFSLPPGDTDVTGDSEKSLSGPWAATNLNSPDPLYPSEN